MKGIDKAKTELKDNFKSFIKEEESPHLEDNPLNGAPVILKSKPCNDTESVPDYNPNEVFYDAVEEDTICTPVGNFASVIPSFASNLQKPATTSKSYKYEVTLPLSSRRKSKRNLLLHRKLK